MLMLKYGFSKELDTPYDTVIQAVKAALKEEGFGVLTEIDVKKTIQEKLGIDMKKYTILGACNPSYAYKAILIEDNIGLMLPCNVIVYEKGNKTVLSIIRPTVAMQVTDNSELRKVAAAVEGLLKKVFESVR